MSDFREKYGEWALITGASSGIGAELARQVAEKGLNVVLVARRLDRLNELRQELVNTYAVQAKVIQLDMLSENAVATLESKTKNLDIGLVIPNAGIETNGEFTQTSLESSERVLQLNALIPMQIARIFGKKLVDRKKGGILFVSSVFGYQGIPLFANYSATKAYILSFGEALNVEMAAHGVDVTVLSPGLTNTEMPGKIQVDFNKIPIPNMQPNVVAAVGLNALGRKATVVPGFINKFFAWENRLIPRSYPVKLFGFLIKRASYDKTSLQSGNKIQEVSNVI